MRAGGGVFPRERRRRSLVFPYNLRLTFSDYRSSQGYTTGGRGVIYLFWVRGCAIGKGIDCHDFGIKRSIEFYDLVKGTVSIFAIFV